MFHVIKQIQIMKVPPSKILINSVNDKRGYTNKYASMSLS